MDVKLSVFGAAGCVTGSSMLLETAGARVLIDCGLFQGPKTLKALNYGPFPFDPAQLDAVLLTHAHVDHSGLIPKLVRLGFAGKIHATEGTIALCGVLLPDAGAIQEMEVEALNRRNERHGLRAVAPIYIRADAEACLGAFSPVAFGVWTDVAPGVRARWWNAGHILGAASIEVELKGADARQTILFSGDVGPGGRRFEPDPEGPTGVDHVVLESTYGAIERQRVNEAERKRLLAEEIRLAHLAGGPLLIPAFAVERTQELVLDLMDLIDANQAPPGPIFVDSPLAVKACEVFVRESHVKGDQFSRLREAGWLKFTEEPSESRAIERVRGWCIIIAASGMCDAGRIRHHLKRLLWRPQTTLMLVGFQAVGTLGRLLQEGRRLVRIQGEDIRVDARVRTLDVYSAHADAAGLARWLDARAPTGGGVLLTHGEPDNLKALQQRLETKDAPKRKVSIAAMDQAYELSPGGFTAVAGPAPRLASADAARLDWHNMRSDFFARLNARLDASPDDAAREKLLAAIAATLEAR